MGSSYRLQLESFPFDLAVHARIRPFSSDFSDTASVTGHNAPERYSPSVLFQGRPRLAIKELATLRLKGWCLSKKDQEFRLAHR